MTAEPAVSLARAADAPALPPAPPPAPAGNFSGVPASAAPGAVGELREIWREQVVRNRQFLGEEGQASVERARVAVIGLGGVGSACALALARSGVHAFRLVDFDLVTLSSLNRHACAARADVGRAKVDVIAAAMRKINPAVAVETRRLCVTEENVGEAVDGGASRFDFVCDCIDNVPAKDPLARAVRRGLKARGIAGGIPLCFSTEHFGRPLEPLKPFQEENPDDYRPLSDFRVRVMPVLGPLPAIFGNAIAAYVIRRFSALADPTPPPLPEIAKLVTEKTFRRLFNAVKHFDTDFGARPPTFRDVELSLDRSRRLVCDVFRGKCPVTGVQRNTAGLQLVPWRRKGGAENARDALHRVGNAVCFEKRVAKRHLDHVFGKNLPLEDLYSAEQVEQIDDILRKWT